MKQITHAASMLQALTGSHFRAFHRVRAKHFPLMLMFLFTCSNYPSWSQPTVKTYHFPDKHNHMIPLPVSDQDDEYVIAGTLGDFEGAIRFMRVKPDGSVVFSKVYREPGHAKTCFDLTAYEDYYILTCLRRGASGVGDRDRIELLMLDGSGGVVNNVLIEALPNTMDCLYPIHSTLVGDNLYIAGYLTEGTAPPLFVDYTTDKRALVIKYRVSSNTITACRIYNTSNTSTLGPFSPGTDYDMAVRVVPITSGDLYLTGSSNIFRPLWDPASLPPSNNYEFGSGTLNMLVDAGLNTLVTNKALHWKFGTGIKGEFGHSLVEKDDYWYNVGNDYETQPDISYQGFVPAPRFHNFSALDPNTLEPAGSNPTTDLQRWQFAGFDYAWGLQTMPSIVGGDLLLAGMLNYHNQTCSLGNKMPSLDNYNPFVADYTLSFTGGAIGVGLNYARTYLSRTGTGTSTLPNSYHATQDWQYNNAWSANFACRRRPGVNDYLALTAPIWWSAQGQLNFKFIEGDNMGDISDCPEAVTDCFSDASYLYNIRFLEHGDQVSFPSASPAYYEFVFTQNNYSVQVNEVSNDIDELDPQEVWDCPDDGQYFKEMIAGLEQNKKKALITISPNPATETIKISLSEMIVEAPVKIIVFDMMGKRLGMLYDGKISGLDQPLSVSHLSKGVYFVQFYSENQSIPTQKLVIR